MASVTRETDPVEPMPADPAEWPAWTDNWFWEISDPCEVAELEAEALEAETDRHDAMSLSEERWLTLMWSGPLPPAATPTDDELGQLAAFGCV
jgi:hypothetical protein